MIFSDNIPDIVAGRKTQTRRLKKAGDSYTSAWQVGDVLEGAVRADAVYSASGHIKWQVGHDYAVQPGRGKLGSWWRRKDCEIFYPDNHDERYQAFARGFEPLRIRILNIRQEDVRTISTEDALVEGFENHIEFWEAWCSMHDKPVHISYQAREQNAYKVREELMERPDERYQAWILEFEAVQP